MRGAATLLILCLPLGGCEENPVRPPPTTAQPQHTTQTDNAHVATLRADRQIVIPNLLFVVQRDPGGSDVTGLTLISSQPAPDGSRMTFGTSQNVANLDRLTGLQMNLGGHRLLDPRGNGVFTSFSAYQPKFATITITKVGENDVSGSVSGEFYRFRALQPAQRPDTVNVEGAFSAVLIIR